MPDKRRQQAEIRLKKGKAIAIDGKARRMWLRRSKANPATIKRTEEKIRSGEYRHLETNADVELYEIAEWSDLAVKSLDQYSIEALENGYVGLCLKRDWDSLIMVADELKRRYSGGLEGNYLADPRQLQSVLQTIEHQLQNRMYWDPTTPSPAEIHNEMKAARQRAQGNRMGAIYLP